MTVHSGDEQQLWEATSQNLTSRATGGRVTHTYRLTTHFLYFDTGGLTGTRSEQIPLLGIQDVDVAQNLLQKTRGLGDVLVHIVRQNGMRETVKLEWVEHPHQVRDLINQTVHGVRAVAHRRQLDEQRDLNTHRYEQVQGPPMVPGMVVGGAVPPMAAPAPMPAVPAGPPAPAALNGPAQQAPAAQTEDDVYAALEKLGRLRDAGVVTAEEFAAKKAELLGRI